MFAINKLISPVLKVIKKPQVLLLRKDKVLLNFWKMVGLIPLENSTLIQLNIHGGVWELAVEQKILAGGLTTF